MVWIAVIILVSLLGGVLYYWLVVVTEGVFLGRRVVVWLYDVTAYKYDRIKEFDAEAERFFLIRPLRFRLRQKPAPLILDVATGTGRLPFFLLKEPTFHGRIIGLDASARMLDQAQAKLRPYRYRTALVQQTADQLPFPTHCFDAVTCLEALEFFPSDTAALREMIRVLHPGGTLLVTRRKGKEGKVFFGRYRNVIQFETHLQELGLIDVQTVPWQVDYDQVYGRKPD